MRDNNYFGFLVHPRELEDIFIKYPYLKFFPKKMTELGIKYSGPIVVSKVSGLKSATGRNIEGFVLGITLTPKQMLENRPLALKRIRESVMLAKKLGVKIMGLGALTASLSRGGLDVRGLGVGINTGRAFTVNNILNYIDWLQTKLGLDINKTVVGVVGAAGSIGSSTVELLRQKGYKNFKLVDLEDKVKAVNAWANDTSDDIEVEVSHKLEIIKEADLIIAATNAPEVIIEPEDLKYGAIVINDAQPSDISPRVLLECPDVLVLEGGAVRIDGLNSGFNFRLQHKNDTFSCMAESIILAANNYYSDFGLGRLDLDLINKIREMSKAVPGISLSPQNALATVKDEHVNKTSKPSVTESPKIAWTQ